MCIFIFKKNVIKMLNSYYIISLFFKCVRHNILAQMYILYCILLRVIFFLRLHDSSRLFFERTECDPSNLLAGVTDKHSVNQDKASNKICTVDWVFSVCLPLRKYNVLCMLWIFFLVLNILILFKTFVLKYWIFFFCMNYYLVANSYKYILTIQFDDYAFEIWMITYIYKLLDIWFTESLKIKLNRYPM